MNRSHLLASVVALALGLAGCASSTEASDDAEATEDAINGNTLEVDTLVASDIVGDLPYDGHFHAVDAPDLGTNRFRALRFELRAHEKIFAEVVTADGSDPQAAIVSDKLEYLMQSDDSYVGTTRSKASQVRFVAGRNATYVLAFRTKTGAPTRFFVRIAKMKYPVHWTDGWAAGPTTVTLTTNDTHATTNASGCAWSEATDARSKPAEQKCTVDTTASTIMCPTFGYGSVTTRIEAAGFFSFDERSDPSRSDVRLSGQVRPGGLVMIESMSVRDCKTTPDGRKVYDARLLRSAAGFTSEQP